MQQPHPRGTSARDNCLLALNRPPILGSQGSGDLALLGSLTASPFISGGQGRVGRVGGWQ